MENDIRDIKAPIDIPSYFIYFLIFCLIVLVIIAVIYLVRILLKRRKESLALARKLPHEIALERLHALRKKELIKSGMAKDHYIELSDIARRYLEDRFLLRAPEMTTEEFLAKLKDEGTLKYEHKALLREFLSACDLVKFAKYGPSEEEAENSYNAAVKLVEQTKPQAPEAQEGKK